MRIRPTEFRKGDIVHNARDPYDNVKVRSAEQLKNRGHGYTVVNLTDRLKDVPLPPGVAFGYRYDNSRTYNVTRKR